MTQRFDKLVALLKELFQLDQPDLDFGFYRVMHAKSAEVSQFLERDLLPQVKAAFAQYQPADKAAIERELAKAIEQARALGADPETLPKVKQLRARLAEDAVDLGRARSRGLRPPLQLLPPLLLRGRLPQQARLQAGRLRHPLRG
jgi:adenine-specific DNA-methyltransferase